MGSHGQRDCLLSLSVMTCPEKCPEPLVSRVLIGVQSHTVRWLTFSLPASWRASSMASVISFPRGLN